MNEIDNRIEICRNRVYDTSDNLVIGKNIPNKMSTKDSSVYRMTGYNQLKDILLCGYVRPRKGKLSGGHKNEVFWSKGSDKLFYFSKGGVIIEAPSDKVINDMIGAVPFEDIIGIYLYNEENSKFENYILYYQELYNKIHANQFELDENKLKHR